MGRAVTLSSLPGRTVAPSVSEAAITTGDAKEMSAKVLHLGAGGKLSETVPAGSDGYVYMLTGSGRIAVGSNEQAIATDSFAAVREGCTFSISASSGGAEAVYVVAPPSARGNALKGLAKDLTVIARAKAPTTYVADQKKLRRYFVAHEANAAHSERAHAMIVEYEKDTYTAMHHHPNADSMFVMLTGRVQFTINGEKQVLERGQAVYFPANDKHALRCADGTTSASFLEFHIPAAFTTVKE